MQLIIWGRLFTKSKALEEGKRNKFDKETNNEWKGPNERAKTVLLKSEGRAFNGFTSVLNEDDLDSDSHHLDEDEEGVVKESCKYIEFYKFRKRGLPETVIFRQFISLNI